MGFLWLTLYYHLFFFIEDLHFSIKKMPILKGSSYNCKQKQAITSLNYVIFQLAGFM